MPICGERGPIYLPIMREGLIINLAIYLGGNGHLLSYIFGKGYPIIWEMVAITVAISLGDGGDLSTHLLGKGMPPIYPSIYEGMAMNLSIYLNKVHIYLCTDLGRNAQLFGRGFANLFIWEGVATYLPIFIQPSILERVGI